MTIHIAIVLEAVDGYDVDLERCVLIVVLYNGMLRKSNIQRKKSRFGTSLQGLEQPFYVNHASTGQEMSDDVALRLPAQEDRHPTSAVQGEEAKCAKLE